MFNIKKESEKTMDKELIDVVLINNLGAEELLNELYGEKLNSKKTILEYIELTSVFKQEDVDSEKIQETYNYIYECIEAMGNAIKPNTMMYLKNTLKGKLGKLVKDKDPKKENSFIKFFKKAYPAKERRKNFTWVLMDINNIKSDQIWTTLTYINRELIKNNIKLSQEEKKDIITMIEKLVSKNNIKYVNQVKSMEKLINELKIKVVNKKDGFKVEKR
ncbi:hypothetical protein [Clostridium sp.]|uniref:hypothetical protein n=1 Tax=Clostridium sp. TaxID=1506 RepID=UPI0026DC7112|nr:hypothetical protein [Clostridium sp.]